MKLASIEKIIAVLPHPNADMLEIVKVLGYQAIVKKGAFHENEFVVFIQPDTVLPDAAWAAFYKSKSNRVKAIRLRGQWSMGIVEPLTLLNKESYTEGEEVSELLGITKYEPPVPQNLDAKGNLPHGLGKTDEERYQNIRDLPFGEVVDVTLKIDGSSLTVYSFDEDIGVDAGITSRTLSLKPECENNYTRVVKKNDILNKLVSFCHENKVNLALRGEMYGQNIQGFAHNPHAKKNLSFALFNVFNLDTKQYEGPESPFYYEKVAQQLGIEAVPMLEKGVILTRELIKKYDEDLTAINGQPFEGVVIKMTGGRSFKVINKDYDSKKNS